MYLILVNIIKSRMVNSCMVEALVKGEVGMVDRSWAPAVRSRRRIQNSEAGRGLGRTVLSGGWYMGVIMSYLSWSPGLIIGTLTI